MNNPDQIHHQLTQLQGQIDTVKPEGRSLLLWKIAQLERQLEQIEALRNSEINA